VPRRKRAHKERKLTSELRGQLIQEAAAGATDKSEVMEAGTRSGDLATADKSGGCHVSVSLCAVTQRPGCELAGPNLCNGSNLALVEPLRRQASLVLVV
jgi:hypothetical protein